MRNVDTHLLGDKMDEAVTHYINTHQPSEHVHIDTDGMPMAVQDDGSRITVMHQQTYSTHLCRQVSVSEQVGEGPWGEELLDPEGRIAAIVAHLANSRASHHSHPHPHHKVPVARNEVDSVILDSPIRFNGQALDQQSVSLAGLPPMQTLPPLQEMKRCETDWFSDKNKKSESQIAQLTDSDGPVLELASGSPAQNRQQNRKSLPHKKRISRKLKRNNGGSTPQQELVVVGAPAEEILPDNYVTVPPPHHMTHEVRPIFICQICGDFYGEEQLKFFHHLKQHYEPHGTLIIDNPVSDLVMDKMNNTCIVDNVATLPDSIVELSLENTVPKTMYQPIDKHTNIVPLNYNNIKVQYSMASEKEPVPVEAEKTDLYESLELYNCGKCSKTFRKQKQCEAHMREAHPSNTKLEDMGEFSEPEDLMAGITVCVSEYEPPLLPHLTVDNGHVHQEHIKHWYSRNGNQLEPGEGCEDAASVYCAGCDRDHPPAHPTNLNTQHAHHTHTPNVTHHAHSTHTAHPLQPTRTVHLTDEHAHPHHITHTLHNTHSQEHNSHSHEHNSHTHEHNSHSHEHNSHSNENNSHLHEHNSHSHDSHSQHNPSHSQEPQPLKVLKEEVLQRIFDVEVPTSLAYNTIVHEHEHEHEREHDEHEHEHEAHEQRERKPEVEEREETVEAAPKTNRKRKKLECSDCGRVFAHRNSLMYHMLSHAARQHSCALCNKRFFTAAALKIHKRVHNGDKPYKCDLCGRDFRQWSDLKYHTISLHSDEKHYKCEFCGKAFARKYSLNVHRRIHTGERNYKCDYCPKTFSASSYRLTHMRTHTGDRPYKCEQCEKSFRSAFDLRRHLLVHDKIRKQIDESKPKPKDKKPKQIKEKDIPEEKRPLSPTPLKKSPKRKATKGAPNVTVQNRDGQFKMNDYNEEFGRPFTKFKIVYDSEFKDSYKNQTYKESDRDGFAVLRPLVRSDDRPYRDNTDGKLQVYTHVEKGRDVSGSIVSNSVLGDIRHLEREVARDVRVEGNMNGEVMENGFLERLTALYNVPA